MKVAIIPAEAKHAADLAPRLRAADVAECKAAGYRDGLHALEVSLENSVEAWAVYFDGELGVLVGVDVLSPGVALVWALSGAVVDRAKLSFLRSSRHVVAYFRKRYGQLVNLVDSRYQGALDWLECLGFTLGPEFADPTSGLPFRLASIGGA